MIAQLRWRTLPLAVTTGSVALLAHAPTAGAAGNVGKRVSQHVFGDFDNDGDTDHVLGFPNADEAKGAVVVWYGGSDSVESWTRDTTGVLDTAAVGDYFGDSIVAGDLDDDGYDDLIIGVPGDLVGTVTNAGSIHVLYGSSTGLTAAGDQIFTQDSTGIDNTAEQNDNFGEVLTSADFDCDGYEDVAVGVPQEDVSQDDAGGFHVIYGSSSGLSSVSDFFHQNTSGVGGSAQAGDNLGAALAPGNFDNDSDSGNACFDLAVGAPGEDKSGNADAGRVLFFYGGTSGITTTGQHGLNQDATGVVDTADALDEFGAALWVYDAGSDAFDDVLVRVPGDTCAGAGTEGFHTFLGSNAGITATDDELNCVDWDDDDVVEHTGDYAECVDDGTGSCYSTLQGDLAAEGLDTHLADLAGCLVAIGKALDSCEDWIVAGGTSNETACEDANAELGEECLIEC